jgi:hypothetical protein
MRILLILSLFCTSAVFAQTVAGNGLETCAKVVARQDARNILNGEKLLRFSDLGWITGYLTALSTKGHIRNFDPKKVFPRVYAACKKSPEKRLFDVVSELSL